VKLAIEARSTPPPACRLSHAACRDAFPGMAAWSNFAYQEMDLDVPLQYARL
jgi:hypothetical protein